MKLILTIFAILAVEQAFGARTVNLGQQSVQQHYQRYQAPGIIGDSSIGNVGSFRTLGSDFGRDLYQEALNKELVVNYYTQVYRDRNLTGIENLFGDPYIQHNPNLPDGKDGYINWLKSVFPPGSPPFTRFTIANIAAEGDLVWIHVLNNVATIPSPTFDEAIVDIYRVQNGLLVEHFDVIQAVPVWSINNHPLLDALDGQYPPKCAFGRVPPTS